ncbi:hypothetical protein [Bifidobacterium tibiigranuli]|uniref:hypothetical protein n=1 Tax=Bifidobacterium tibiigranuli TaxID=2172043 RepID=UPI00235481BB|nr:hypothetical protein [Bifidobacterium tibiigranuli]MCI1211111.1 hypothetical protein [Bifidobacterium tibiigranuli]MCI1220379.1 hypothetical protein [Bifidobacterium tibiigranuli]MCI1231939.1 hypothetical protein [Bifidobacterium tibiigranuli]MCI1255029.1 hypothetical protein [Bifidobacterium tibiigranuli]
MDGDFGDQLSAANLYFLMQRRQVDVIPDSLSYTDKDISFILSNGDETMALHFTPYLNHNEKLTDVYYRPLGSDMKSAVGIEWETSDNNANCITVYSITSDIANTVPQLGNVYGRFKILKGKPDWLLDFHLHYVGSAAEHGVKQRLLNPHHIIERLACTADVYRSGAKIGFELCALPLRAEVHFGFNNIESSDDLIYKSEFTPDQSAHEVEKALIKGLKPKENVDGTSYSNYPKQSKLALPESVKHIGVGLKSSYTLHTDSITWMGSSCLKSSNFILVDREELNCKII